MSLTVEEQTTSTTNYVAETTVNEQQQQVLLDSKQQTMGPRHKIMGDIINVFVLVSSIAYMFTVVYFTQPGMDGSKNNIIDEGRKKDGFCIQNIDVPFWSSFDTCLYVDVSFSIVLFIMYLSWRNIPGMEPSSAVVPGLIAGTVGHGLAHAAMAVRFRDGSYQIERDSKLMTGTDEKDDDSPSIWLMVLFAVAFWFPLLHASIPKMKKRYVLLLSAVVVYCMQGLRKELGFGYVQTVLAIAVHISQLISSSEEKHRREYMTMPLSALLPIVTSWNELLFCNAYFRSMGGHVLYDASIIISYIVFYLDCYRYHVMSNKNKNRDHYQNHLMKKKML